MPWDYFIIHSTHTFAGNLNNMELKVFRMNSFNPFCL